MKWTEQPKGHWVCNDPGGRFRIEVSPKGDGRWDWRVFADKATGAMASGIARNLGAAKSVAEQFVARNSLPAPPQPLRAPRRAGRGRAPGPLGLGGSPARARVRPGQGCLGPDGGQRLAAAQPPARQSLAAEASGGQAADDGAVGLAQALFYLHQEQRALGFGLDRREVKGLRLLEGRGDPSRVTASAWHLPEYGRISVTIADYTRIDDVDATWKLARQPGHSNAHWVWRVLTQGFDERFAVTCASSDETIALWAGKYSTPRLLGGVGYYRLDYFEVSPLVRTRLPNTKPLSGFCLALVACRALETGASAMVLNALKDPGVIDFYLRLGGAQESPAGWTCSQDLTTIVFSGEALTALKELVDDTP